MMHIYVRTMEILTRYRKLGSRNMAVMGQIPCSTECIYYIHLTALFPGQPW